MVRGRNYATGNERTSRGWKKSYVSIHCRHSHFWHHSIPWQGIPASKFGFRQNILFSLACLEMSSVFNSSSSTVFTRKNFEVRVASRCKALPCHLLSHYGNWGSASLSWRAVLERQWAYAARIISSRWDNYPFQSAQTAAFASVKQLGVGVMYVHRGLPGWWLVQVAEGSNPSHSEDLSLAQTSWLADTFFNPALSKRYLVRIQHLSAWAALTCSMLNPVSQLNICNEYPQISFE